MLCRQRFHPRAHRPLRIAGCNHFFGRTGRNDPGATIISAQHERNGLELIRSGSFASRQGLGPSPAVLNSERAKYEHDLRIVFSECLVDNLAHGICNCLPFGTAWSRSVRSFRERGRDRKCDYHESQEGTEIHGGLQDAARRHPRRIQKQPWGLAPGSRA